MSSKKFTDLNAGTIGAGSIFAQAQEPALSGDPYTSTKVSATQIANYVAKGQAFTELNNQTIIQAITGGSGAGTIILTMAQYLALTPAAQTDGHIYVISDFACLFCYGRQYRAVQKLTQAQYDQLSTAEKNDGTLYIITDAATSIGDADDVDLTGLAAGNILRAVSDGQGGIIFKPFAFNVTTSDNNKLLGVSVSGSDISVGAVTLTDSNIQAVKGSYSGIQGVYGGYISSSKNYFDFFIPFNTNGLTSITNISFTSITVLTANGLSDNPFSSYTIDVTPMGLFVDCRYSSTQATATSGTVTFSGMAFTAS